MKRHRRQDDLERRNGYRLMLWTLAAQPGQVGIAAMQVVHAGVERQLVLAEQALTETRRTL